MGYGSRALQLLQVYYEGGFPCLEEKVLETSREIHTVSSEVSVFWLGYRFLEETRFFSGSLGSSSRVVSWPGLLWAAELSLVLETLLSLQLTLKLRPSDQHHQPHLETC